MALERFIESTRHMIIFNVLREECPVGDPGDRIRLFLSEEGYKKALRSQEREELKIISHSWVIKGRLSNESPYEAEDEYDNGLEP
jgi:hypothetical protein